MDRRSLLRALAGTPLAACHRESPAEPENRTPAASVELVLRTEALRSPPWPTPDPFLFCVHHDDAYPAGNDRLGPNADLAERTLGNDFSGQHGFSMYHGEVVPGFPRHPHRGFETITIVRQGLVDHSDSLGAAARYGHGDVQWLTAGKGIVHAEMFPLLERDAPNPLDLFQLWLNLPSVDKFAEPHFSMLWNHTIPKGIEKDSAGRSTELTVVAGKLGTLSPPAPPPKSWAARTESEIAIWTLKMAAGARFTLPAASAGVNRTLYFFRGNSLRIGVSEIPRGNLAELDATHPALLENGGEEGELLVLQGRPIGEPTVKYGPFVMNSREQIQQAYADYRQTSFGGWPWPSDAPVHGASESGRFARHADGRIERAT
jgi:redox-sensitive bicupin YhaK (pirin superfamily)